MEITHVATQSTACAGYQRAYNAAMAKLDRSIFVRISTRTLDRLQSLLGEGESAADVVRALLEPELRRREAIAREYASAARVDRSITISTGRAPLELREDGE